MQEQTESKYAKRLAYRKSQGGRDFQSLGKDTATRLPTPKPLLLNYIPNRGMKVNNNEWKFNPVMKHENLAQIRRFQNPAQKYSKPRINIKRQFFTKQYDHFAMNYAQYSN